MGRRAQGITIGILSILAAAGMVGCSQGSAASVSPTNTVAPTVTLAPTVTVAPPTATATTVVTETDFTCATTTSGATKTFHDSQSGLSFSYPASWTEQQCQRLSSSDGTSSLFIGNIFSVSIIPRHGQTVQQYVNATKDTNETVTFTPFTAAHAVAAYALTDTIGANPQPEETFVQTIAIVEGSQNFYLVHEFIAQMSTSDTMPGVYGSKLVQQVVTTFNVP